ncbi:MAG: tripartite tricarboxylate transporter TctB family protein, partial [Smithellaceae bacterium]|nr:tripartite tricarboxylate transporter TctB family protein [Smithellaceae bacterium]
GEGEATEGRKSLREYLRSNPGEVRVLWMVAIFILYLIMIKGIGFFVSNFFFIIAASRLTVSGDWKRPLVLAVALSLFCYLLFEVWLKLSLPRGVIF